MQLGVCLLGSRLKGGVPACSGHGDGRVLGLCVAFEDVMLGSRLKMGYQRAAGMVTDAFSDYVVGHGELWCAQLFAATVRRLGTDCGFMDTREASATARSLLWPCPARIIESVSILAVLLDQLHEHMQSSPRIIRVLLAYHQ